MSELDDRLKRIPIPVIAGDVDYYYLSDTEVARFKQAFQEAGYINPRTINVFDTVNGANIPVATLLTGQEWLDRFTREYEELLGIERGVYIDSNAMLAAKRAANIIEDTA